MPKKCTCGKLFKTFTEIEEHVKADHVRRAMDGPTETSPLSSDSMPNAPWKKTWKGPEDNYIG